MKFKCPGCKQIIKRDLRLKENRAFLNKRGWFKSYCDRAGFSAYCRPVKP